MPNSPLAFIGKNIICELFIQRHRGYSDLYCIGEIFSTESFCNTEVAGLGEIFVQRNFWLYSTVYAVHLGAFVHDLLVEGFQFLLQCRKIEWNGYEVSDAFTQSVAPYDHL